MGCWATKQSGTSPMHKWVSFRQVAVHAPSPNPPCCASLELNVSILTEVDSYLLIVFICMYHVYLPYFCPSKPSSSAGKSACLMFGPREPTHACRVSPRTRLVWAAPWWMVQCLLGAEVSDAVPKRHPRYNLPCLLCGQY